MEQLKTTQYVSDNDANYDILDDDYRTKGVIKLANGTIISLHTILIQTSKLLTIKPKVINKHIAPIKSIRGKSVFNVLLTVYCRPNCTIAKLTDYVWSDDRIVKKCLLYLVHLGLVTESKRPRKMPIGCYVVDNTYRITNKGRKVLRDITGM